MVKKMAIESVHDLIEEAKSRTLYWALCIFVTSYFLTHTSKSMWMNLPIAILIVYGLRFLSNEVEFRWKAHNVRAQTHLAYLEKKQLSVNDSRLSMAPPPPKWKRKIDSVHVEAAIHNFVDKILRDFVVDLWYSDITTDKEAPELIRSIIMEALGEICGRVKEVNIVDLLTRNVVDLVGDHLDLFRRNQTAIGVDVMGTLSSEERDERLKYHLLASNELHPALISPECEHKVLQQLVGGLLAIVLRPREAQCPIVRCIGRELLACLILQPVMNLASPGFINELIESIFLANKEDVFHDVEAEHVEVRKSDLTKDAPSDKQTSNLRSCHSDESIQFSSADWARTLEAATQRRTEVLMPDNLENMWTKGWNYKKAPNKEAASGFQCTFKNVPTSETVSQTFMQLPPRPLPDRNSGPLLTSNSFSTDELRYSGAIPSNKTKRVLKRSSSASDLTRRSKDEGTFDGNDDKGPLMTRQSKVEETFDGNDDRGPLMARQSKVEGTFDSNEDRGPFISEFYSADICKSSKLERSKWSTDMLLQMEDQHASKLRCQVLGAYFEKLGSKYYAVYSIAVTDANSNTWFVNRRYKNFERLHGQLKEIPNYTLHLPPKRIFASSTEDAFVRQRCIQLDRYLQDLLSIANVAEQHEVWDFLSVTSKNYSSGKSSSVKRPLAVNVDDAMDDIVRQSSGVSDGLMRKLSGSPRSSHEAESISSRNMSWNSGLNASELPNSLSHNEEGDKDLNCGMEESGFKVDSSGYHSDNELNLKRIPPRVISDEESRRINSEDRGGSGNHLSSLSSEASSMLKSENLEDPMVPPEWTPPNLSVPILNLVDNIFQLKRRGWLRRQVFWISKQILQLVMEDAIDDWLLRQIHMLRREQFIVYVIQWLQDILWPGGTFFTKLRAVADSQSNSNSGKTPRKAGRRGTKILSFEEQLEAARRASDVKKMIFNGAPTTLVSLIGYNAYHRCAKDIYYFLQSSICLKQLVYGILELLLITLFPELRELVRDIHEKSEFNLYKE